jgi:hypothetical protein
MQQLNYLTRLLGFQGVYVSGIEIREEGDIGIVLVDLKRQEDGYICSGCGRKYSANTAHGFRRSGIFTYGDI